MYVTVQSSRCYIEWC